MNATFQFSEKAIMALPMIFIIMCGDIDISIASIIALCAYAVGTAAQAGASIPSLLFISLLVGTLAGLFNGVMITGLNMPAIAVTLATQSMYRGISIGLLGDQARTSFPDGFGIFGQEFIPNTIIPYEFVLYLALMLLFAFILHKTTYGRRLYAIGNSAEAARFSGVNVKLTRIINFTVTVSSAVLLQCCCQPYSFGPFQHCNRMGFGNHHLGGSRRCCDHRRKGDRLRCFRRFLARRLFKVRHGTAQVQRHADDHRHRKPVDHCRPASQTAGLVQGKPEAQVAGTTLGGFHAKSICHAVEERM
jgi:ABC-type glucose/galactose transport system permease subunit